MILGTHTYPILETQPMTRTPTQHLPQKKYNKGKTAMKNEKMKNSILNNHEHQPEN